VKLLSRYHDRNDKDHLDLYEDLIFRDDISEKGFKTENNDIRIIENKLDKSKTDNRR
jgi:hypothetical protein